jgi:hypothetical protein
MRKRMMCIDKGSYHLTEGKIYDLVQLFKDIDDLCPVQLFDYYVTNDKGYEHYIEGNLFIDLDVFREKKLNELGI